MVSYPESLPMQFDFITSLPADYEPGHSQKGWDIASLRLDLMVSSRSLASIWRDYGDFRSTPVNGHSQDRRACVKGANRRHRPPTTLPTKALRPRSSASDLRLGLSPRRTNWTIAVPWLSAICEAPKKRHRVWRNCRIQINMHVHIAAQKSSLRTRNENASSCIRLCIARASHLDRTKFIRTFRGSKGAASLAKHNAVLFL
jgi:hypothetical protein